MAIRMITVSCEQTLSEEASVTGSSQTSSTVAGTFQQRIWDMVKAKNKRARRNFAEREMGKSCSTSNGRPYWTLLPKPTARYACLQPLDTPSIVDVTIGHYCPNRTKSWRELQAPNSAAVRGPQVTLAFEPEWKGFERGMRMALSAPDVIAMLGRDNLDLRSIQEPHFDNNISLFEGKLRALHGGSRNWAAYIDNMTRAIRSYDQRDTRLVSWPCQLIE